MHIINEHNYEAYLLDFSEGHLQASLIVELRAFIFAHPELGIDLLDLELPVLEISNKEQIDHNELLKEFTANEELVLHYCENLLSAEESKDFEEKIQHDHRLKSLFENYRKTYFVQEENMAFDKSCLHKTEDAYLLDNSVLNYLEGQLNWEEKLAFEMRLETNAILQSELKAYSTTLLQADLAIKYPNIADLRKEPKVISLFGNRAVRFAAAASLFLLIFSFLYWLINPSSDAVQEAPNQLAAMENKRLPENKIQTKKETVPAFVIEKIEPISRQNEPSDKGKDTETEENTPDKFVQNTHEPVPTSPTVSITANPTVDIAVAALPIAEDKVEAIKVVNSLRYNSVDELAVSEDLQEFEIGEKKSDLWHKAIDLAKRANKMGITAVTAEESKKTRKYRLSLNSFSVEKH